MNGADDLQFDKAEYGQGGQTCVVCRERLMAPHYLLGTQKVCTSCRANLLAAYGAPIGAFGYAKALAAGGLVGIGCTVAWALIRKATGMEIGIVAIGVGWAVAEAMRRGAGRGSRALQICAVIIAYLAIVESYVPDLVGGMGDLDGPLQVALAWLFSSAIALAMPYFVIQTGVSAALWYLIVGFGLRRAWVGLTPPALRFVGPIA